MCVLYSETASRPRVMRIFDVTKAIEFDPLNAIFPGYDAPVIRAGDDGARELAMMSWGFPLQIKGKATRRVVNVRDDKVRESFFWRSSFEQRRCLVPATSFCESSGEKPATWHWFGLKGSEPRPLFAFAGIWRTDTYAIMTTTPNELVEKINHERMPVLLTSPRDLEVWLYGSTDEAFELVRPFSAEHMHIVRRGTERSDPVERPTSSR